MVFFVWNRSSMTGEIAACFVREGQSIRNGVNALSRAGLSAYQGRVGCLSAVGLDVCQGLD